MSRRRIIAIAASSTGLAIGCAACGSTGLTLVNKAGNLNIASCQVSSDGGTVIATGSVSKPATETWEQTTIYPAVVLYDSAGAVISNNNDGSSATYWKNPNNIDSYASWQIPKGSTWQASASITTGYTPTECRVELTSR